MMTQEKNVQKKTVGFKFAGTSILLVALVVAVLAGCNNGAGGTPSSNGNAANTSSATDESSPSNSDTAKTPAASNADLIIPISELSETAKFYQADIDGTTLEVLAVKAPDGSIRTAFNTCQVCFDSGRGYYKQSGNSLVCQNCGNRFTMDQVEVAGGGCNPVPIFPKDKTVDETSITISKEYLANAKSIFANWKN